MWLCEKTKKQILQTLGAHNYSNWGEEWWEGGRHIDALLLKSTFAKTSWNDCTPTFISLTQHWLVWNTHEHTNLHTHTLSDTHIYICTAVTHEHTDFMFNSYKHTLFGTTIAHTHFSFTREVVPHTHTYTHWNVHTIGKPILQSTHTHSHYNTECLYS